MHTKPHLGRALLLLSALLLTAAASAEEVPTEVPSFAVTRMHQAPVIDGAIDVAEWQEALAISGVADQSTDMSKPLLPRPTTFYLGWDPEHLYFAARTYIKPGHKPAVTAGRSQGLAYVWDAGLELNWHPMGSNVPAGNKANAYKWFLNALGFIGDTSRLALGQQFKSWNPQFEIQARLTDPGTAPDGGRWWEMEMRATPEDFELEGAHRAGDQWRMMLGINHFPAWMQARIPCRGPYLDPYGFNLMTLVDETPAVQMTMDSIPNLATDGTAAIDLYAFNPTDRPVELTFSVSIADALERVEILSIPPGRRAGFSLNKKLPENVTEGLASVEVTQGERSLFSYSVPFSVGAYASMLSSSAPPDTANFAFETRFNPVRSWLLVKGDTYFLEDATLAKALHYRVFSEAVDKPIATGSITQVAEYYLQDIVQLPTLEPGTYHIEATMELTNGRTLGPMRRQFIKKDEAKEYAHWWKNEYGNVERVLPPYTALVQKDESVASLGRTYHLNALGLPKHIVSNGADVSAAPARVVIVRDGVEHVVSLGGPRFTETTDWRVRFTGQAQGAGLTLGSEGWVEQDGLVYIDLTYGPSGDDPVEIDALRLEYPLSEEDADALLCIGPGNNYSSRTTMLLPKDATGSLWSTLDTGINGSGMTVGSFYPTVWIGSERRGFLWWADNDRGWIQNNAVPAHEVVRRDEGVVLINHIVAQPTSLGADHTLALSYIATPFKPMVKGWRMTQSTEDGTFHQPFRNVRTDSKTGLKVFQNPGGGLLHVNWIHPESRYPEEWEDLWHQQRTEGFAGWPAADSVAHATQWRDPYAARKSGFTHMSFQVYGYGRKTLEDHLYDYFGSEWEATGNGDTWHDTYTDYAMYLFEAAFNRGGVRSTYWDLTFPLLFSDPLSGLAYRLPDGRMQSGYHGWNLRRFYKRLYAMQYDAGLVPGANGFHSTNAYLPVAMTWTDAVLDGERNWDLDSSPLDWVDNMPIERMRSMSIPQSWGVAICWMANMDGADRPARDLAKQIQAQWVWMHDSWRNTYIPQLPVMPEPVLDWGTNNAKYHPYWRNEFVTGTDPDLLVSLWRTPERIVLGLFNHGKDGAIDDELRIDLAELGLDPQRAYARTLWDMFGGQATLDETGSVLQVRDLPSHRLLLVGLAEVDPSALEQAGGRLPAQYGGSVPSSVVDFGLVHEETQYHASGTSSALGWDDDALNVGLWQRSDRILLSIENTDDTAARDAAIRLDLDALGLRPQLPWQEFVGVRDLNPTDGEEATASLDYHNGTLHVESIAPQSVRLVAIRLY